jgi:hypothetical protein
MMIDRTARIRYYDHDTKVFESRSAPPAPTQPRTVWLASEGPHSVQNIDDHKCHAFRVELLESLSGEPAEVLFERWVASGAQVRQPLADTFGGDRRGQLDDRFGHRLNIGQHVRDVPHDEVLAAAVRAFG